MINPCRVRVVHAAAIVDIGGAPFVAQQLTRFLPEAGVDAVLVAQTLGDGSHTANPSAHVVQTRDRSGFGVSRSLSRILHAEVARADVVHSHSLWMFVNFEAHRVARRHARPHVLAPHGALEPWALSRSHRKKAVMRMLFQGRALQEAACLHALSSAELLDLRKLGLTNPIAVVPNGVTLATQPVTADSLAFQFPAIAGRKILLFLGRLHPKKGLTELVDAWVGLSAAYPDWVLLVAGPDEVGLRQHLEETLLRSGSHDAVLFTGNLTGEAKAVVLGSASAFVLPSFSEGFSIALLEAMAAGVPAVITPACNFPEAIISGAAIACVPTADSIREALSRVLQSSAPQLRRQGEIGRRLVADRYSWTVVAQQMAELYGWLLGRNERPQFVDVI